jgi:VWFA-related protein
MIVSFDYAVHHLSSCQPKESNHVILGQSGRKVESGTPPVDTTKEGPCLRGDLGLTSDRKILEKAINRAKVGQYFGTTLNDAVMEVANNDFRNVNGRKAIILLSDGKDFGSAVATEELLAFESESDTMVYSIFYASDFGKGGFRFPGRRGRFPGGGGRGGIFGRPMNDQFPGGQQRGQRRRQQRDIDGADLLSQLSEITSGRFYRSDKTNLTQTFTMIADELRHQYRLGFYPGEIKKDGSVHELRVKVDLPDAAIRSRKQYRAQ